MIDIRRAIESIVPGAAWDFSIPNEGGTEAQYAAIHWSDARPKPAWTDIVAVADGFAAADLLAMRQSMTVGPLQLRRALRQTGDYATVVAAIAAADEATQEAWEYATEVRRLDPMIEAMRAAMGQTPEEVDALFTLAVTL
jgi:UDP-glucose 4-epimerase